MGSQNDPARPLPSRATPRHRRHGRSVAGPRLLRSGGRAQGNPAGPDRGSGGRGEGREPTAVTKTWKMKETVARDGELLSTAREDVYGGPMDHWLELFALGVGL